METITNAILTCSSVDEDAINELRGRLASAGIPPEQLVPVGEHSGAYVIGPVLVGSFPTFHELAFVEIVRGTAWEYPSFVELRLRRSGEGRFEQVRLFGPLESVRERKQALGKALELRGSAEQEAFFSKLPELAREFQIWRRKLEWNGLRFNNDQRKVTAMQAYSLWKFEVISVWGPRGWSESYGGTTTGRWIKEEHRMLYGLFAYRGEAARLKCDSFNTDPSAFEQAVAVHATIRAGDIVEFSGSVVVDEDLVWELSRPTVLRLG